MYRYSENTRKEFLSVLHDFKERLWLPEQASLEFFKNRLPEISTQVSSYDATKRKMKDLRDELMKSRGHPHVSDEAMQMINNAFNVAEQELDKNQSHHLSRINNDDILVDISELFSGRIGEPYNKTELDVIINEGSARMESEIPPGYMDFPKHKKPINDYQTRANVGDYIVFKQTMDLSKEKQRPVILVTGDLKEDWWLRAHGRTVGARPELLEEFHNLTGQEFLLYDPEQFLRYAKEHLQSSVSSETLQEVKESSLSDEVLADAFKNLFNEKRSFHTKNLIKIRHKNSANRFKAIAGTDRYSFMLGEVRDAIRLKDVSKALALSREASMSMEGELANLERYLLLFDKQDDLLTDDMLEHVAELEEQIKEIKKTQSRLRFYDDIISDLMK